jgi:hypothetical protein
MTAAQRQRLHRRRAADGIRVVSIQVGPEIKELLLGAGLLQEWSCDDAGEVGRALEKLLGLLLNVR